MSSRVRVYADTNALFPYYLSDLLLWLSNDGVIRLMWSLYLVDEIIDVVPRRWREGKRGRSEQAVRSQWDAVIKHLRRDEVPEVQWRARLSEVTGPDPDDLPHMAAAVAGGATVLLTSDRRGFPPAVLTPLGVRVQSPDAFLCEVLASDREAVLLTLRARALQLRSPAMSVRVYLGLIGRSAPRFASAAALAAGEPIARPARVAWMVRRLMRGVRERFN